MKIIYLPGKSLKNKEEGESICSALKEAEFEDIYFHHWPHWKDESAEMNIETEVGKIRSQINEKEDLVFIAKSLGSFVAMKVINFYRNQVKKVVLLGIPVDDFSDPNELNDYPETLKLLNASILVIQNKNDNHGSSDKVKNLLQGVDYKMIEKDAADHAYYYSDDIVQFLKD